MYPVTRRKDAPDPPVCQVAMARRENRVDQDFLVARVSVARRVSLEDGVPTADRD